MDNLKPYFDFIESCRNKKYEFTHKHHIIPKHMGGTDDEDNLIKIGYKDHQKAHLILAECFDKNSKEYQYNILSAIKLRGWAEDNSNDLITKLSEMRKGKTFEELFGKEISEIAKNKISIASKKMWSCPDYKNQMCEKFKISNHLTGRLYEDVYGKLKSDEIKESKSITMKNYWGNVDCKETRLIDMRYGYTHWYSNLTENEKNDISKLKSENAKKYWDSMDNLDNKKLRNSKISNSLKGRIITEEWRKKISENHADFSGKKNPMYGKNHSSETKLKQSKAALKRDYTQYKKPKIKYEVYLDEILVETLYGQLECKEFSKNIKVNFQKLFKGKLEYKNYSCKKVKI